jgi:hypothetical protein
MTMNRFLYALANPATLVDPDGRMALNESALSMAGIVDYEVIKAGREAETRKVRYEACGYEGLKCRSDPGAGHVGAAFGVARSAWDIWAGVVSIPGAVVRNELCTLDAKCANAERDSTLREREACTADVGACISKSVSDAAFGAADWVGEKHDEFTTRSLFDREEAMTHFIGGVEVGGLSAIYTVKAASGLLGARGAGTTIGQGVTEGGYSTFSAAKKGLGSPGSGWVYDHVVEQSQMGASRSGFLARQIHNPENLNPVLKEVNQIKANYYSTKQFFTGGATVRDWLNGQSFLDQWNFGMSVTEDIWNGVIQ